MKKLKLPANDTIIRSRRYLNFASILTSMLNYLSSIYSQQQQEDLKFAMDFISTLTRCEKSEEEPEPQDCDRNTEFGLSQDDFDWATRSISLIVAAEIISNGRTRDENIMQVVHSIGKETIKRVSSMSLEEVRKLAARTKIQNEKAYRFYTEQAPKVEAEKHTLALKNVFAAIYDAKMVCVKEQIRWVKMNVHPDGGIECDVVPMDLALLKLTIETNDYQYKANLTVPELKDSWQTIVDFPQTIKKNPQSKFVVLNFTLQDFPIFCVCPDLNKEKFIEMSLMAFQCLLQTVVSNKQTPENAKMPAL